MTSQSHSSSDLPSPSKAKRDQQLQVGQLGEWLVAQWLTEQGWTVIAQGWRSRWGEIDIVARQRSTSVNQHNARHQDNSCLAFVEVKTRSHGNWDADGLLAITAQKQAKLWKTAQLFLSQHAGLASLPCRFDVALVKCQTCPQFSHTPTSDQRLQRLDSQDRPLSLPASRSEIIPQGITLGRPIVVAGHQLTLQTYLDSAFAN